MSSHVYYKPQNVTYRLPITEEIMKQPVIRLHPDVFDKLDALARDYYLRTGENITMSKIIDKLLGTVDKIEIVTITVNGTK